MPTVTVRPSPRVNNTAAPAPSVDPVTATAAAAGAAPTAKVDSRAGGRASVGAPVATPKPVIPAPAARGHKAGAPGHV